MTRRVALTLAAVSLGALTGCGGVVGARMTFDDTETAKITDIVLTGGSSDVVISTATGTETRIRRIVQGGGDPGSSYERSGSVLTLALGCGRDCRTNYEITAPAGVTVRGDVSSGDLAMTGVGPVDVQLSSGDVMVENGTGPVKVRAGSGDINVIGGGEVALEVRSGDINVQDARGPVTARATSGDVNLALAAPASVSATVNSGNVSLSVPEAAYQLRTQAGSGERAIEGIRNDPKSSNILDLRVLSGDLFVTGQ